MNEWIKGLKESSFVFGTSRIKRLLKILENPEKNFSSIHITGSNGKGSVATFIFSVLKEAGYKVGLYTSPHLIDFRERIRINNKIIPKKKLETIIQRIKKASEGLDITYFEAATAIAFLYFAQENIDIGIIEVGLGGRLDATNTIKPLLSIITNISLEHTNYLGDTIEKIAREKAGIIKKGIPVIIGRMDKKAQIVIEECAKKKDAQIFIEGRDFIGKGMPDSFEVRVFDKDYKGFSLGMIGNHQVINASLAIIALEVLKKDFPYDFCKLKKGLKNAYIKGRMDIISKNPLIIVDGAHNPEGAKILREALNFYFSSYKPIFIIGILKDKDKDRFLSNLDISSSKVIVTEPKIDRRCHKELLFEIVKKYTSNAIVMDNVSKAIEYAKNIVKNDELICICGSFYLIGEAIKYEKKKAY
ncbi:MAG: folylpolyglutamate synthase/dihydrofolate synthase family protein [bacterium]